MPRIDPVQLLNCLSVLLSPNGGIKSRNEVQRLAGLMTKFSKKLVSKCIYIQILKCTETDLLGLFMGSGGWLLVHMWLTESIVAKNWPLVKELLELLLLCPVDIERLKTNNCPKLVKELSKDGNHYAIRALASKLVEQWLKTVKGEPVVPIQESEIIEIITKAQAEWCKADTSIKLDDNIAEKITPDIVEPVNNDVLKSYKTEAISDSTKIPKNEDETDKENQEVDEEQETLPVLKISLKDGKQVISQMDDEETTEDVDSEKSKEKSKSKSKEKSSDKSSSSSKSSSKHSSKSHSSSSSDKRKSSQRSSSSGSSSSSRSKDSKSKDKDKHSSHKSKNDKRSSEKSSLSSKDKEDRNNKSDKDKNKDKGQEKEQDKNKSDKNKDTQKISNEKSEDQKQSPSIHKLGKIPKLSEMKKEKPSISIEVRKPDDPKPKTVKTFHSKFRKHGLEEEIKPPPSRASLLSKKVTPVLPPTVPIPKRSSPVHNESPPEKKPKTVEHTEKPGSIKLIPAKPKREKCHPETSVLARSVLFSLGCNNVIEINAEPLCRYSLSFHTDLNLFKERRKSKVCDKTGAP